MEFRILGPLEVVDEGPVALPRGRARALLALLTLRAGEIVAAERLIDELWGPAPPPTAPTALHGLVSTLRKRLEPAVARGAAPRLLVTRPPGYLLRISPEQIDAHRFRRLVAEAAEAPARRKAALLRDALGLWRGMALADLCYEPFAQAAIADLEESRLTALEERIDADLAVGRHAEVVGELGGLVAEHPLRERLRAQLMLALYRCGRQADALASYREARRRLVDELGVEPGPQLRALEQAVLAQEPALELPPSDSALSARTGSADPWLRTGRKAVTVMFVDLSESGPPPPQDPAPDPEAARLVVRRAYDTAVGVLDSHGAAVEGFIGDVVVAVFGMPVIHEDDALRAVRAAYALRARLAELNAEAERAPGIRLAARIGINSGEVVVGDPMSGATATSGAPVALAARLQQAAHDGEVLLGETTRRLAGEAAVVEPADPATAGGTAAWRLVDVAGVTARAPTDPPHVGRAKELSRVRDAFDRSVKERRAVLVTVIGEAGIGKSRLAREFAALVRARAQVVTGHCPSYGAGITFWPLREVLDGLVGGAGLPGLTRLLRDDPDPAATAAEVAAAAGLSDDSGPPGGLFAATRRVFEAAARRQPLVVVFEDLQWAQPTFLDLIESLAGSVRAPLLMLCLARPEFQQRAESWARDLSAGAVPLSPLDIADSQRLISHRLGDDALPTAAATRVVRLAGGNPLFLEQLLAAFRDDLDQHIPPTVQALLAARLDQLGPAERNLLRCASVIGLAFSVEAVSALVADEVRPYVHRYLEDLRAKELLARASRSETRRARFRFRHALIQMVAYGSLTRQTRSELHERYADWLEGAAEPPAGEVEALVGRHLEQAYLHRRDLGLVDGAGRQLALRAGERLASAGLRAYRRFDIPAAENLLTRARALLPADHPQRPTVLRRLTEVYPVIGRSDETENLFTELLQTVSGQGDDRLLRGVVLEQSRFRMITGPDPIPLEAIRDVAEAALVAARRDGDEVGMSQASYLLAWVHLRAGRMRELEAVARQGLAYAQRSGDLRERLGAPWWIVFAMLTGPTPVPGCLDACERVVNVAGVKHPAVLAAMAEFHAMVGEFEAARGLLDTAREVLRDRIRVPRPLAFVAQRSAAVELLAGDPDAAASALRPALDLALRIGEREEAAQIAAVWSLLDSDRAVPGEAARLARLATEQAPAQCVSAQALAEAARARVLLDQGNLRAAERLSRTAVEAVPDDMLELRARLQVGLGRVLLTAGRSAHAARTFGEAVRRYERKGNLVAADRTRALAEAASR